MQSSHFFVAVTMFVTVCACAQQPAAQKTGQPDTAMEKPAAKPTLPKDVAQFAEQRDACDHFRGEEAYDAERATFLTGQIEKNCTGTDKMLQALRQRYKDNAAIIDKLKQYEDVIE
ncbi:MAG: hypothetical protein HC843_13200 [Sphingomonadales bacterium]|nr:hypothetical protein [Sphingomonadales bacterium]